MFGIYLAGFVFHPLFLSQQQQQCIVNVLRQHQEGQHPAGEEALYPDAEPGAAAGQRLPQHEAGLLQ